MKVYALVGKSGTGKSYQAMNLCKERDIESIIDDGLYINRTDAVAGISAKRQPTMVGAIKTALFTKDDHRNEVADKIRETRPTSILVIGTSDGMVARIVKRLNLPEIAETIYIEEITTDTERHIAQKQRVTQGKHVVPAPTFQLKRQFSGYFMDPLRIFKGWGFGKDSFSEKSVVRPTYSYLGDFIISDRVITDIIEITVRRIAGVSDVSRVIVENRPGELRVTLVATFELGCEVVEVGRALQKKCTEVLETMTAFNIDKINIEVRGLA
ncbi:MAG: hypothetical protein RR626_02390 [Anaerovoracaceae bacterium]